MSKISTSDAEHHEPSIVALSFRRGTIVAWKCSEFQICGAWLRLYRLLLHG